MAAHHRRAARRYDLERAVMEDILGGITGLFSKLTIHSRRDDSVRRGERETPTGRSSNRSNSPPRPTLSNQAMRAADFIAADRYEHIQSLTYSSEGDVGIVRSRSTGKLVVVKHTNPGPPSYPNEARILLQTLRQPHENTIALFAAEKSWVAGRWLLYIEHCSGGDLLDQIVHFKRVLSRRPVPEVFVLHVFVEMAQALAWLHHGLRYVGEGQYSRVHGQEAVIHGDIKPDNIFLRWRRGTENDAMGLPTIVLADFGAAQVASRSKGIRGTPGYDSPEVRAVAELKQTRPELYYARREAEGIMTTKSDVYQLGLVMYMLCTYQHWMTGRSPVGVKLEGSAGRGYQTAWLDLAVRWCLRLRPEARPEATMHPTLGCLGGIDRFRRQRNRLAETSIVVGSHMWKQR